MGRSRSHERATILIAVQQQRSQEVRGDSSNEDDRKRDKKLTFGVALHQAVERGSSDDR